MSLEYLDLHASCECRIRQWSEIRTIARAVYTSRMLLQRRNNAPKTCDRAEQSRHLVSFLGWTAYDNVTLKRLSYALDEQRELCAKYYDICRFLYVGHSDCRKFSKYGPI